MTKPSEPRRRQRLVRRVGPPIAHTIGVVTFQGLEILAEHSDAAALILWHACRDAWLWFSVTDRAELFSPDSYASRVQLIENLPDAELEEVKPALYHIASILRSNAVDPTTVTEACNVVAEWSEERARFATAIEFAQVAAIAAPEQPSYAVRAARLLRMRGEYERAITWFDHTIAAAREVEDWGVFAQAYAGLGCLHMQRGNYPRARKALLRSLRKARRHGLKERVAAAYHNLFAVEAAAGNWPLAEEHASRALRYYPSTARGLPRLARDLGYRWILRGYFERALLVAQEVLPHFTKSAERALVLSDIARAGAGCGRIEVAEDAWAQAYTLALTAPVEPFQPDILLNLTHACISRGDIARARMAGLRTLDAAKSYRRHELILETEAAMDSLRSHLPASSPKADRLEEDRGIGLATSFVRALQQSRPGV